MDGTLNVLYETNGQRCTCKVRHSKKYTNIFTIHKYIKIYVYMNVYLCISNKQYSILLYELLFLYRMKNIPANTNR